MSVFVSQRLKAIQPSGLSRFFDILATTQDVLSLGLGEPDMATPQPIRQAACEALASGRTGYTSNAGTLELRRAIAQDLSSRYHIEYNPEREIVVTAGVSEGLLAAILAVLDPGDAVLLPEPCFTSYDPIIRLASGVPMSVVTTMAEGFEVTRAQLDAAWRPGVKALLLNYPNNPTGATLAGARLKQVGQFARERDIVVISDEIYERFTYCGEHTCFASLPGMWERTILLGGFSKSLAMTGWRVGYACAPEDIIQAMQRVHQFVLMSAPTLGQIGAHCALTCGRECAQEIVDEFARRRQVLVRGLRELGLPCATPRGAIYAFPSVQGTGLDCESFAERLLLDERVAVVPGTAFGAAGAGCVRIAYTVPVPRLEQALERMGRFVRAL